MNRDGAIRIDGAVVVRGGRRILEDLDLTLVEPRVALVGRNGSGKSTLARLIKGLIRPDRGRVRVADRDPAQRDPEAVGLVGFLFQNSDHQILCPTVLEEISFGMLESGHGRREAGRASLALMEAHGVATWRDRPVAELSEGQRRLVCLLAVLVMTPRVLVLDEPFTGLDIPTRHSLAAFIAGLPVQVVMTSHDPEMLSGFDRVLWLEAGRLRRDGPPEAVLPEFLRVMRAPDSGALACSA